MRYSSMYNDGPKPVDASGMEMARKPRQTMTLNATPITVAVEKRKLPNRIQMYATIPMKLRTTATTAVAARLSATTGEKLET